MTISIRILVFAAACAASLQLPAQPYDSAFKDYRPFEAGEVRDWRTSNDTVRGIGGWRAYAREMRGGASSPKPQAPQANPQAGDTPTQPARPDPHEGHRK